MTAPTYFCIATMAMVLINKLMSGSSVLAKCKYYTKGLLSHGLINREYFTVKIFSDSVACTKIKRTKIHACAILQGRLSENYLTRKFIA